jgi:hypothetical protein
MRPMTYQLGTKGKQYLIIAAGGHSKISEEAQSDRFGWPTRIHRQADIQCPITGIM